MNYTRRKQSRWKLLSFIVLFIARSPSFLRALVNSSGERDFSFSTFFATFPSPPRFSLTPCLSLCSLPFHSLFRKEKLHAAYSLWFVVSWELKGHLRLLPAGGNYKMKFFRKFLNNAADYSMGRAVEENGPNRLHLWLAQYIQEAYAYRRKMLHYAISQGKETLDTELRWLCISVFSIGRMLMLRNEFGFYRVFWFYDAVTWWIEHNNNYLNFRKQLFNFEHRLNLEISK